MKRTPLLFLALFACKPNQPATPPVGAPAALTDSVRPVQRSVDTTVPPVELQAWFALPDTSGTLLVCMGHDFLGPGPFFLVNLDGHTVPLEDVGIHAQNEHGSGREISRNFWDVGGHLFRIDGDSVVPERSYLVASNAFLELHHPVQVTLESCLPMDSAESSRLTWTSTRRVRKAWSLGRMDSTRIAAVQFIGMPPLAALVVARRDSLLSARYPGETTDTESVWRVDDEGQFDGCALGIIAAFRSAHGIEIAQSWGGAEGESDMLLQQSGDTLRSIVDGYRYWSPQ